MELYTATLSFLEYLTNIQWYKQKTIKDHTLILRDFKRYLYAKRNATAIEIVDIRIGDIMSYLDDVSNKPLTSASRYYGKAKKISQNTLYNYSCVLRNMRRWIEINEIEKWFRREAIPKIKTIKPKIDYLTKQEVDLFFEVPDKIENRPDIVLRNKVFILTCFVTGTRASEALNLKFSDITADNQIPIQGKRDKHRGVFINDRLRGILLEYKKVRDQWPHFTILNKDSDYIFTSLSEREYGKKLGYETMRKTFKRYSNYIGLKKSITPHVLRHSYATHLLKKWVELMDLMVLMWHQYITTTQRYLHIENSHIMEQHRIAFQEM